MTHSYTSNINPEQFDKGVALGFYKDVMLDYGYRLDLIVEEQVIIEIKSVTK